MVKTPVELHIISDAAGETATRLVMALEAQFPEETFEEIRHPRVETVEDLQLAVDHREDQRLFDLQIALTAVENGAREIWTHDRNFLSLPGLRVRDPLA